ncbi:MAG: molybdopterin-dependent oxidoreductase [Candidatus Aminicenantes bacterium]|nr:molybdopterin-dependent oxidoreductase [Candidatus Aminicenantes bacterium]
MPERSAFPTPPAGLEGAHLVRSGCPAHNCGGRCLLHVWVRDGKILRIDADDRPGDEPSDPQLRACIRGRAYRYRQNHKDRLRYPMKRIGKRGEAKFTRISWEEAFGTMAERIVSVRDAYGPTSIFVPYGTGSYNLTNGRWTAERLLNLVGGSLGYYNSYSWACISAATPTVFGTNITGNQRQDWLNAKLILMWSWNPAEMRDGTNSEYFIRKARERGARVVCLDPRMTMSAVALADEWIPVRPGTDAALMSAMAYVMITEGLVDRAFIRSHCLGFDASQMPAGAESEESYEDYILGRRDGIPKTPGWAEPISAMPRATIARLAREYATIKPAVLYQGYGMQRRAYGEQAVRAGCVLAAITGNVGIPGGWAGGIALQAPDGGPRWEILPLGENPVTAKIPSFLWSEAVLRGRDMGPADGVVGADRLGTDIKLIWSVASNILINQHGNVNRSARILADESRVEFLAVQDNFMTPTARFADLLLPACTQFETWGVQDGWKYGEEVILAPKIVEPAFESKSDYAICAGIAAKLGVEPAYTEGRDERGWVEWAMDHYRKTRFPDMPTLDELEASNSGMYVRPVTEPAVAFADFRRDPQAHPLPTPSGKIEIFSKRLFDLKRPDEIPAVPKYIREWESPFGPEAAAFPLQVIGHHALSRVHSIHDNVPELLEAFPQRIFMNPLDADPRGITDGDPVRVWNDRGALILPVRLTSRVMPGVLAIPQGAWWTPDRAGTDRRGNVNVLTSERWTPYAFGNAQHTIMAQAAKAGKPGRRR